ncbi:hypothetical protein DSECCO2_25590 [anaerobic digester metagenome]
MNKIAKYFWPVIAIINTIAICSIAISLSGIEEYGLDVSATVSGETKISTAQYLPIEVNVNSRH